MLDKRETFKKSDTISYEDLFKRWGVGTPDGITAIELVDILTRRKNGLTVYSRIRERGDSIVGLEKEFCHYEIELSADDPEEKEEYAHAELRNFFLHGYFFDLSDVARVEKRYPDILPDGVQPLILWDDSMDYWACRIFEQIDAAVNNVPTAQPEAVGTGQEEAAPVPTQDEQAAPRDEEEAATSQAQWEAALKLAENTSPKEYKQLNAYYMRHWKGQRWQEIKDFLETNADNTARNYDKKGKDLAKEKGLPLAKE